MIMKKALVVFGFVVMMTLVGCGKYPHISKILKEEATETSVFWLELIKENGINFNIDGYTLLGVALQNNRIDMVEALIKDKVDVNRPAINEALPLGLSIHRALKSYNNQSSKLLVDAGANLKTDQFDSIFYAVHNVDIELFNILLPKYSKSMLDYSKSLERSGIIQRLDSPYANDENYEIQLGMIEDLMANGIKFSWWDVVDALHIYLDPENISVKEEEIMERIIAESAKEFKDTTSDIYNYGASEANINLFDIASVGIQTKSIGLNNSISTSPDKYMNLLNIFISAGYKITPEAWQFSGGGSSKGTINKIANILYKKMVDDNSRITYSWSRDYVKEYDNWTSDKIIDVLNILHNADALYAAPLNTANYNTGLETLVLTNEILIFRGKKYIDVITPYLSIYKWFTENGYFGDDLQGEIDDPESFRKFLVSCYIKNSNEELYVPRGDPSVQWSEAYMANRQISIAQIKELADSGRIPSFVLEEAQEILDGERVGLSRDAGEYLGSYGTKITN
jgi:hypothetical protein